MALTLMSRSVSLQQPVAMATGDPLKELTASLVSEENFHVRRRHCWGGVVLLHI